MVDVCDGVRMTLVGCGKAKREVSGNPNYANNQHVAAKLYTSTYFRKKREYAAHMGEYWRILSAKAGLYHPYCTLKPYDVALTPSGFAPADEAPFDSVEAWAADVIESLDETLSYLESSNNRGVDEIVVLAGKPYVDPLREGFRDLTMQHPGLRVRLPFEQTSGIGEQMSWLTEATDTTRPVNTRYASFFEEELGVAQ